VKRTLARQLGVPTLVFLAFAGAAFFSQDFLGQFGTEAISQSRKILGYIVQIGIWLASAFLLNRLLHVFLWQMVAERALGGPIPRLIKDVVGALIYLVAITGIVRFVFEQPVTGIWATSGALGLVIGFALRSMILDVFSGLAINVDRPYAIGHWIMLHGRQLELHLIGNVTEINWRTTRLRTTDNNLIVVPNSVMARSTITNFMLPDAKSRLELFFPLDYSVPSERALRVLTAGVRAVVGQRGLLENPRPKIRINIINEMGVEYRVRYWILPAKMSPNRSRHTVITSILEHLQHAGLTLAYPKRDIFHAEMPQRQLDAASLSDRVALLSRVELFAPLEPPELEQLARDIGQRDFAEGEELIRRGESGDSMFVLVEGLVYVYADVKGDGTEVKVAQIVPGQFFGEMSLLTGEARSATVTAASSAVAYEITKDDMSTLLGKRPDLAQSIGTIVAERKLRNQAAGSETTVEAAEEQHRSLTTQIVGKMRAFFRGVL